MTLGRLVHITTVPDSLRFLSGQASYMKSLGWEVHAISSPGPKLTAFGEEEGVEVHPLEMPRRITPIQDLRTVAKLTSLLRDLAPTIVHSHTPKGGLLGMIAATAAGVPARIYHMRGLPYSTATGARRRLLMLTERTSCALSRLVLCQSHSLREQAISDGLCSPAKIKVLGGGSNGVDAHGHFNPERVGEAGTQLRRERGWNKDHVVIGFVGRLVRDKGITELTAAWRVIRERMPQARLVLVGPFEPQDPVAPSVRADLESDPRVHLVGYTSDPAPWYAAMDVFVLPSYREGFPNAPLEAAAMELPVVATTIPGCIDAVQDGVTGLLVPPLDAPALTDALLHLAKNSELRRSQGQAGRARALLHFSRERIWFELRATYERLAGHQRRQACLESLC